VHAHAFVVLDDLLAGPDWLLTELTEVFVAGGIAPAYALRRRVVNP